MLSQPVEATADGLALAPWQSAALTLGNAIKLANNVALGRDAAGVRYRPDNIRALFVGEQQALGLLRDYSRTYNERFEGFIVRKFNGDKVKIAGGQVALTGQAALLTSPKSRSRARIFLAMELALSPTP